MNKNKTHRIISISPSTNYQQPYSNSHKLTQNKTTTPIKPIQSQTRTNTAKNIQEETEVETVCKTTKYSNAVESIVVSTYREESGDKVHGGIDDVLVRIGNSFEVKKNSEKDKKQCIESLRETIAEAKYLLSEREEQITETQPETNTQKLSNEIKQQISEIFTSLHNNLNRKEKLLYDQLEEKIFELSEKTLSKKFQTNSLKNYIDKCEKDLNNNEKNILEDLHFHDLYNIVNQYKNKINDYTDLISNEYTLKFNLNCIQIDKFGDFGQILLEKEKSDKKEFRNKRESSFKSKFSKGESNLKDSRINKENEESFSQSQEQRMSLNKISNKKSIEKHIKNTKSNFEDLKNVNLNKINMRKFTDQELRISSARGKY